MPNVLSVYDPIFYAQEALIALEKALGMASRVFRGYDKSPNELGSIIAIRKPSTFTAINAPSAAQDILASSVSITLDQWKEVKFKITDKELAYTGERLINEHIRPAAYALADVIDQSLVGLYKDVPWSVAWTAPAAVADITNARKTLFNNNVPMDFGMLHLMVDGTIEAELLNLEAFSQYQGAGPTGERTQLRGTLGTKFGFEVFANQNVASHTSGVAADFTGAVNNVANYAAGTTTMAADAFTIGATVKAGDTFSIAGQTQRYAITADATADGAGAFAAISFTPPLVAEVLDNAVLTITLGGASKPQSLAFHRNAFALAMAPLPDIADGVGARIATVQDPITGLSLRSRVFYVGDTSTVYVALDVLYGVKTLEPNMAVRITD